MGLGTWGNKQETQGMVSYKVSATSHLCENILDILDALGPEHLGWRGLLSSGPVPEFAGFTDGSQYLVFFYRFIWRGSFEPPFALGAQFADNSLILLGGGLTQADTPAYQATKECVTTVKRSS